MSRALLVLILVGGLLDSQHSLIAAQEIPKGLEVSYTDLRLHIDQLRKRPVALVGTFHYHNPADQTFQLRMGENTVDVEIVHLPEETQQSLRDLRDFSEIKLTVFGVPRRAGVQLDRIIVRADRVDIDEESSLRSFESRRGIVTVPEIRLNPFRFVHSTVTMRGRFDFRDPNTAVFRMWRGVDTVEVSYGSLTAARQREILALKNFSDRPLKVTGTLRPAQSPRVAYLLEAESIEIEPALDDAQLAALDARRKGNEITYSDILRNPGKFVNPSASPKMEDVYILKGGFEIQDKVRKVFEIWQGGDSIEVFYEKVPVSQWQLLDDLKPFSSVLLVVHGTIAPYQKSSHRYFIQASQIEFEKRSE